MATPEGRVKAKISAVLKARNIPYVMPIQTGYGRPGISDYICCVNGRFVAVEAKVDSKSPIRPTQKIFMKEITDAGGEAIVVHKDNIADLEKLLDKLQSL